MEMDLERKYLDLKKQLALKEKERELDYTSQLQALSEKEEQIHNKLQGFEVQKHQDVIEVNKKIKTMHELIKTVMNLHHEDFNSFEQSNNKVTIAKTFSFDMTSTVKEINNDKDSIQD